jgi:hypothetical protein
MAKVTEEKKDRNNQYVWAVALCKKEDHDDDKLELHTGDHVYYSYESALDAAAEFLRAEYMGRRDIADCDEIPTGDDTPKYKLKWDRTELFLKKYKDTLAQVRVTRLL